MSENSQFYAEGNNGGDYIKLKRAKDDEVLIEVGQQCAIVMRLRMPIEVLISLIAHAWDNFEHVDLLVKNEDELRQRVIKISGLNLIHVQ